MSILVPYITTWSGEDSLSTKVIERPGSGIAFADETLGDRDARGVLWRRVPSRPGLGRPQFGKIHPLRQRRAMRKLLCQVCGGPADQSDLHPLARPRFPRLAPLARTHGLHRATRLPTLRPHLHSGLPSPPKGYVAVRVANSEISGIYGARYIPGPLYPHPVDDAILTYDDPAIRWTCAGQLVRELLNCTIVTLDKDQQ